MVARTAASAARLKADALLFPVVEGVKTLPAPVAELDQALSGGLGQLLSDGGFTGRLGEVADTLSLGALGVTRVALVGMGPAERLDRVRLSNALQLALPKLPGPRGSVALQFAEEMVPGVNAADLAEAAVEAAVLSGFTQATHRSLSREGASARSIERLTLVAFPRVDRRRLEEAEVLAEATNCARELVNTPASTLTPVAFAAEARRQAATAGLAFDVLDERALKKRGYGALLAVGAGSALAPRLVTLRYRPAGRAAPRGRRLALVGKGITFDSGGISIKPSADMQYMKGDMGGAAAVLGAMIAIGRLKPRIEVIGVLCLAENMVSDRSMRPGDVVRSGSGITIEVTNTDAEGRMVLADGVHHAVGLGATDIIDIATLTGGQRVALGPVAAAVISDTPALLAEVTAASRLAGERLWELPAFTEYETLLDSPIADLNNAPGPNASAITAGLFVRRFAAGKPWVHLDIAAPSWNRVSALKEVPSGPSGFGVRTLARLALGMGQKS
ncbi:MAG TPA: leucyl aminopeptidase [Candidatus Dormibacteraeota bacterium]|nr:leucyl aminopeptidase [Candidatus Dormibacteraeota bacterium]